jgi:transcriptional antiterminator
MMEQLIYFNNCAEKLLQAYPSIIKAEVIKEKMVPNLLIKPNMTEVDKTHMRKVVKLLQDKKLYTPENIRKLETINYNQKYIEI